MVDPSSCKKRLNTYVVKYVKYVGQSTHETLDITINDGAAYVTAGKCLGIPP